MFLVVGAGIVISCSHAHVCVCLCVCVCVSVFVKMLATAKERTQQDFEKKAVDPFAPDVAANLTDLGPLQDAMVCGRARAHFSLLFLNFPAGAFALS